jgi:hypothetical protein
MQGISMSNRLSTLVRRTPIPAVLLTTAILACGTGSPTSPFDRPTPTGQLSVAYGKWSPGPFDTCSKEIHDSFSTVGPDGKMYPTWHPPIDPGTGCTFGHEHGADPRTSFIYDEIGDLPLGLANEMLDIYNPGMRRHEDHFGHKYEVENGVEMSFRGPAGAVFQATCNFLIKMHQGSHSKDAFTNNMHEISYHARCSDGTGVSMTFLTNIGDAGEFVDTCTGDHIQAGTASPPNSPDGGGKRIIPTRACAESRILVPSGDRSNFSSGLRETWQVSESLRTVDNKTLASINPYFNLSRPSRFFDPSKADLTGRPIDLCYAVVGGLRARGGDCEEATGDGAIPGITFDDPRSPFDGVGRDFDINSLRVKNEGGPTTWYTDPLGEHAQTTPFPGSIKQYIASIDNTRGGADMHGPRIGKQKHHGGPGVHAPN